MTPEKRERFAILVERRLADLLSATEMDELSGMLETSDEARQLYLRAVEFHMDLETVSAATSTVASSASPRSSIGIPGLTLGSNVPESHDAVIDGNRFRRWMVQFASSSVAAGFILVAILFGLFFFGSRAGKAPEAPDLGLTPRDRGLINSGGPGQRPGSLGIKAPPPPPPPSALYNSLQIQELRHAVYANVWLINMTTLVSECMRYRNLTNEWAQLQADVANYDRKIKSTLGELAKVGEKQAVETYLQQGDQILGFAQRDFTAMKPGEAAQILNTWINNWRAGPALEQVNVARGDKKLTIYLEFPEDTKELLTLARYPALRLAGDPGTGIVTEQVAIPADMLKNVNGGFESLPSGYRGYLIPADRKRLEELSLNKRGSSDDVEWLKARILGEALPSFQREADMIRSKVLELEPKLKESVASDVINRKNGTKVEGQIIEETETYIKIKTRFGAVPIPKDEIAKVEKGKGSATEFPKQFTAAKGDLVKLTSLLAWCAEKNLKLEKEYVGYVILTLDASHEKARAAVGLGRPAIAPGSGPSNPPKSPGDGGGARLEAVDRTVEIIANDVTSRNQVFTDVVTEMRRRTETLTTGQPPMAPDKAVKGATLIGNPLTFKPSELTVPTAMEIGSWWSQLSTDERRQFAKYYGLWCAYTRAIKK